MASAGRALFAALGLTVFGCSRRPPPDPAGHESAKPGGPPTAAAHAAPSAEPSAEAPPPVDAALAARLGPGLVPECFLSAIESGCRPVGDFDGDGEADKVVLVRDEPCQTTTDEMIRCRQGLVVLLASGGVLRLGAGTAGVWRALSHSQRRKPLATPAPTDLDFVKALQVVRGKPGTNGRSIEVELLAGPIVRASPPGLRGDALLLDSGHEVYLVYSDREGWASYQVYGD